MIYVKQFLIGKVVNKDNLVILTLNKFKIAKDIDIKFSSICNIPNNVSNPNRFKTFIQIKFKANEKDEIMLNLDYLSYEAIEKLNKGYKTNKNEQRELLLFNDFINQLINSVQSNEYTIYNMLEDRTFELKLNEFDQYVFKRV